MMNLHMKRNITSHQREYFSKPYDLETPNNMNIEQGESLQKIIQIREPYFEYIEVFTDTDSE